MNTKISLLVSEGLLGIELDDKLLLELKVDVVSCGKSNNLGKKILSVIFKPLRSSLSCHLFSKSLDLSALLAGFLNGDNVTCLNEDRGDVYLLTVKSEVSVKNELTSFLSGCSHTHSDRKSVV